MTEENKNETLVQTGSLKRSNRVTFIDNRTLRIDTQTSNNNLTYRIDVIALRAKHSHRFAFAWPWLIAAIVLLGLLLAEISTAFIFPDPASWLAILAKVMLGLLSAICLLVFFKLSHGKYVFKSRHARIPLLDIWTGKPSRKAAKTFVKLLEQRIQKAHDHMNLTEEQQLTGEIKMLRRLAEEGVMPTSVYESAKPKLFKKF